jgi:vacuolar-type H+-ATPase subunit H
MSDQNQGAMLHEMLGRFIEEAVARALQDQMGKMVEAAEKRAEAKGAEAAAKLDQTLERATADIQERTHQMIEQGLRTLTAEAERLVERNTQRVQEISQMIEQGLHTLTAEAERLVERNTQRAQETSQMIEQGLCTLTAEAERLVERNTQRAQETSQMIEQGLCTLTAEAERLVERNSERVQAISSKALDDIPVTIQESLMQMTQENEILFHRRAEEWMGQFRAERTADISQGLQAQVEVMRRSMLEEVAQSAKAICDRNLFDFRSEFENHLNRSFQHAAERLNAPMVRQ